MAYQKQKWKNDSYVAIILTRAPEALRTIIADKFHVVKHIFEAVQAYRLRLKQEELSKIPATKKERRLYERETRLVNGESRTEMLTRSRYLLFKKEEKWTPSQQKRASLLFETFPQLKSVYKLTLQIRQLFPPSHVIRISVIVLKLTTVKDDYKNESYIFPLYIIFIVTYFS